MEAAWRPKTLDLDPSSQNAAKEWRHWKKIFLNYLEDFKDKLPNFHRALIGCVSSSVYEYIENCTTFKESIEKLDSIFIKTPNEVFARHMLATRRQKPGESLDDFYRELEKLRRNCNFKAHTAVECGDEAMRDAFISGLASPAIRQRLLENKELNLETAYNQASALDLAQQNNDAFSTPTQVVAAVDVEKKISRH